MWQAKPVYDGFSDKGNDLLVDMVARGSGSIHFVKSLMTTMRYFRCLKATRNGRISPALIGIRLNSGVSSTGVDHVVGENFWQSSYFWTSYRASCFIVG